MREILFHGKRVDNGEWVVDDLAQSYKAECFIANGVTFATDTNVGSKWISVKDRLPDKHDRYLCNVKAFSFPDLCYFAILKYDDGGFIEGKIYTDDVTHWMPLPKPPKEGE